MHLMNNKQNNDKDEKAQVCFISFTNEGEVKWYKSVANGVSERFVKGIVRQFLASLSMICAAFQPYSSDGPGHERKEEQQKQRSTIVNLDDGSLLVAKLIGDNGHNWYGLATQRTALTSDFLLLSMIDSIEQAANNIVMTRDDSELNMKIFWNDVHNMLLTSDNWWHKRQLYLHTQRWFLTLAAEYVSAKKPKSACDYTIEERATLSQLCKSGSFRKLEDAVSHIFGSGGMSACLLSERRGVLGVEKMGYDEAESLRWYASAVFSFNSHTRRGMQVESTCEKWRRIWFRCDDDTLVLRIATRGDAPWWVVRLLREGAYEVLKEAMTTVGSGEQHT